MTTSTTVERNDSAAETTFITADPAAIEPADREPPSTGRRAVFAAALIVLIAAVAGIAIMFPGTLGAAIAIAVVAAVVLLELLFSPRAPQRSPETYWAP
jgi:hypothetical protein